MDNRFSEVGHHANEVGVPLVCNLGERPDAQRKPSHIVWEVLGQAASHIGKKNGKSISVYLHNVDVAFFSLASNQNTIFQKPTNPQSETLQSAAQIR